MKVLRVLLLSFGAICSPAARSWADEDEPENIAFGVLAHYAAVAAKGPAVERIEAAPRLFGRPGETPAGELPPGPFKVQWTGLLAVAYRGEYTFTALRSSLDELQFTLDGQSAELGKPIELKPGQLKLAISGVHKTGQPAFELWWRSQLFGDEPIEARFFGHAPDRSPPAMSAKRIAGAVLAETHGCFRCHQGPKSTTESLAQDIAPAALLPGPRLDSLARRVNRAWLLSWLKDPHATRFDARMPALFDASADDQLAARTVAEYLASGPGAEPNKDAASAERGAAIFKTSGCAACHAPKENEASIDATLSRAPSLDGLAEKWTLAGLAEFLEKPLDTRAHGRMPDFALTPAQSLDAAQYLLSREKSGKPAADDAPALSAAELASQWKQLVGAGEVPGGTPSERLSVVALRQMAARQCFSCHDMKTEGFLKIERSVAGSPKLTFSENALRTKAANAPALVDLSPERIKAGCLAEPAKAHPSLRFAITAADRAALSAYVESLSSQSSASTMDRLRVDLAVLNCARCHDNEGRGGEPLAAIMGRSAETKYFSPPMLTRVAERLRPERLNEFIVQGARDRLLRRWVGARMPGFGPHGARLAADLASRDSISGPPPVEGTAAPTVVAAQVKNEHAELGRFLVGAKALACVNCHTLHGNLLAGQPDPTTRGPDLDRVAAHLRPEYFRRWMLNPARVRPGTKMPAAIQPDGRVAIPSLSKLVPGAPLDALWTYLMQGGSALPPIHEQTVLVAPAPNQPVVQRGEVAVAGGGKYPRGAAIGFVDGTLLFDADRLSLAAAWYGGFVSSAAAPYFGLWWHQQGANPDLLPAKAHPLAFKFADGVWQSFALPLESDPNEGTRFEGHQLGKSAVRLRYRLLLGTYKVAVTEDVRLESRPDWQGYTRWFRFTGLPVGAQAALTLPPGEEPTRFDARGEKTTGSSTVQAAPLLMYRTAAGKPALRTARAISPGGSWFEEEKAPRVLSAPAKAGQPVELRVDYWTFIGKSAAPSAGDLALLYESAPVLDDEFGQTIKPSPPLPKYEVSAAPAEPTVERKPTRPAVNHKENVDEFTPVKARFLRFKITATEQNANPGIDELEIYGADPKVNLALTGKATASSVIQGHAIHQIKHLNDGKLGNSHSWISNEAGHGWAQIEFPEPVEMQKIVWARDRTGSVKDRLAIAYRIEVSDDGANWKLVKDDGDRIAAAAPGLVTAAASPGYLMESIPAPFAGCRPSDVAFDSEGAMYASAMTEGQVWRAKMPPDGAADAVRWQRFATGLYHPIGLQIVDGRIFVCQKPEITELIDHDGDGAADEFRTAASGWGLSTGWHEYTFGLAQDDHKSLWFALNTGFFWTNPGYVNPGRWRGSVMKYSVPSDKLEVVAKGCRVPNGICRGPAGEIFYTDNQGDWIQSCKLAHVLPGRFYGHPEHKEDALPKDTYPEGRSAVWMPYHLSKSTSGPVHDATHGKFGPFDDQMFLGDVGYGANPGIMRVALEKVDGEYQGACFRFVDNQPHGCVRMKFGPDNQLYICSLTTGLTRMKFKGPAPLAMQTVNIRPGGQGFVIKFTKPLAAETKLAAADFRVKRYHYLYTGNYGSPQADETNVPVQAAELSSDRTSITLTFPVETYPIGMVYEISAGRLMADGGEPLVHNEAWYTVQRIPK